METWGSLLKHKSIRFGHSDAMEEYETRFPNASDQQDPGGL
jgi:hypothetical protein